MTAPPTSIISKNDTLIRDNDAACHHRLIRETQI
jgi:hypothetical protein